MQITTAIFFGLVFYALTPGVLLKMGQSKLATAATHTLIFGIIWYLSGALKEGFAASANLPVISGDTPITPTTPITPVIPSTPTTTTTSTITKKGFPPLPAGYSCSPSNLLDLDKNVQRGVKPTCSYNGNSYNMATIENNRINLQFYSCDFDTSESFSANSILLGNKKGRFTDKIWVYALVEKPGTYHANATDNNIKGRDIGGAGVNYYNPMAKYNTRLIPLPEYRFYDPEDDDSIYFIRTHDHTYFKLEPNGYSPPFYPNYPELTSGYIEGEQLPTSSSSNTGKLIKAITDLDQPNAQVVSYIITQGGTGFATSQYNRYPGEVPTEDNDVLPLKTSDWFIRRGPAPV